MKRMIRTLWTIAGAACMAVAGVFGVHAEEATEQLSRAAQANQMLDTIQGVSLWILIIAVSLFVGWYVIKTVLERIHVPPEQKEDIKDDKKEDI